MSEKTDDSFSDEEIEIDSKATLNEEEMQELKDMLEKAKKSVTILCGGPIGSGKSTLLNSVMGVPIPPFKVGEALTRGTLEPCKETYTRNGVEIILWDTPGLERNKNDQAYLEAILKKCKDFDIFLYCIKVDEDRATELLGEKSALFKFTKAFGPKLWRNAIIALTFSNRLAIDIEDKKERDPSIDIKKAFQEKIDEWKSHIKQALERAGVEQRIITKIPFQPSGFAKKGQPIHLPGHTFWLSKLHQYFFKRVKSNGLKALVISNSDRYNYDGEVNSQSNEVAEQDGPDQPLKISNKFKVIIPIIVGVQGAVVGAGIGATIGALAIGIPTLGVAVGAGLVIGGAIGAAAGTSVGISIGGLVYLYRRLKSKKSEGRQ